MNGTTWLASAGGENSRDVVHRVEEKVREIKAELSDMYESLARRMIDSISDDDILKLDGYRRTVAGAVATDKMQMLRNQSPTRVTFQAIQINVEQAGTIIAQENTEITAFLEGLSSNR